MKADTYRKAMFSLACLTIVIAIVLAFYTSYKIKAPSCPVMRCPEIRLSEPSRDRKVIEDPLYPPLNRSSTAPDDAYRLIGYVTSEENTPDAGNNHWKLFGRMKNRHEGEYYLAPIDKTMDLKIPLTRENVTGEKLRDVYTLPSEMRFKSPMLHETSYKFTELPKADLGSSVYV